MHFNITALIHKTCVIKIIIEIPSDNNNNNNNSGDFYIIRNANYSSNLLYTTMYLYVIYCILLSCHNTNGSVNMGTRSIF